MPRLRADITITWVDRHTAQRVRLDLIAQPCGRRVWLRRDGRNSRRLHDTTVSEVLAELRRLTVRRVKGR